MRTKEVTKGLTVTIAVLTVLALCNVIDWWLVLFGSGVLFTGLLFTMLFNNFNKLFALYYIKKIKSWHGKNFTATLLGVEISGKIAVQEFENATLAYLCFNEEVDGVNLYDNVESFGFKNHWFIGTGDLESLNISGVTNLKIDIK